MAAASLTALTEQALSVRIPHKVTHVAEARAATTRETAEKAVAEWKKAVARETAEEGNKEWARVAVARARAAWVARALAVAERAIAAAETAKAAAEEAAAAAARATKRMEAVRVEAELLPLLEDEEEVVRVDAVMGAVWKAAAEAAVARVEAEEKAVEARETAEKAVAEWKRAIRERDANRI